MKLIIKALSINVALCLILACNKGRDFTIPDVDDSPELQTVKMSSIHRYSTGYGIAIDRGLSQVFEINVDSQEGSLVRVGQSALVSAAPDLFKVPCHVIRVLRHANQEAGQSIVWLKPDQPTTIPSGEFVSSQVVTDLKRDVLLIPKHAVLVRDGKTWVIQKKNTTNGQVQFSPTEIRLGLESENDVEISSGLAVSDQIVIKGGIGFLTPSFQQKGGSD